MLFRSVVDVDGDESDQVQGDFIINMAYDKNDRVRKKLNAMIDALDKMKSSEDYGKCEECDEDIGYKRLLICPDTKYCIHCAELIEIENKQHK